MPVPKLGGVDPMPARHLARLQQIEDGGRMRAALVTRLIPEGLAKPAALGVGFKPEMRDHFVCRQRFGHRSEPVLALANLAEDLERLAPFHAETLLDGRA